MPSRKAIFDPEVYEAWYSEGKGARLATLEKGHLKNALDRLRAREILDVGCGTGHFTRWLRSLGLRPTGVDVSPAMVRFACGREPAGRVPYAVADARRLPFRDGAFDAGLFVASLEFIPEADGALAEAARVSRRGIVLLLLNPWHPLNLLRKIRGLFGEEVWRKARFLNAREIRRAAGEEDWVFEPLRPFPSGAFRTWVLRRREEDGRRPPIR